MLNGHLLDSIANIDDMLLNTFHAKMFPPKEDANGALNNSGLNIVKACSEAIVFAVASCYNSEMIY